MLIHSCLLVLNQRGRLRRNIVQVLPQSIDEQNYSIEREIERARRDAWTRDHDNIKSVTDQ